MPSDYILITPIKNEEKNIEKLIAAIVNQTIHPILWVIVNDHSTDNSYAYVSKAEKEHPWIRCIKPSVRREERDLGFHLPKIMQEGFDFAYKVAKSENISFDYVGNIDGDLQPNSDYFENLIREFKINSKLGVASGMPVIEYEGKYIHPKVAGIPSGGAILIDKTFFETCGGIPQSYSYDSVLNVKAILGGWEAKRFTSAEHYSTRYARGADSDWKRYVTLGKSHYYIGYNFLLAMLKGIKMSLTSPHIKGIAYVYGYLGDAITFKDKIPDKNVKNYFKYKKFKEIADRCLNSSGKEKELL